MVALIFAVSSHVIVGSILPHAEEDFEPALGQASQGGEVGCALLAFALVVVALTGERIRRKLRDGTRNTHVYYRCGNNSQATDHPKVRWRETDLETAIVDDLDRMRMPDRRTAEWFRNAVEAAFDDVGAAKADRRRKLTKRRTELKNMQDRLLNGYLGGAIDEQAFGAKSFDLKQQADDVERQFDETDEFDPAFGRTALAVFDLTQNLASIWRGSNSTGKRTLLKCVSLNRTVSDTSVVLTKRKPFDLLVERPLLKKSRGEGRWG